ncbi:MAG: molybdopterin-dependent oxidoreductase [Candidatus Hodarchaeota archaeon]
MKKEKKSPQKALFDKVISNVCPLCACACAVFANVEGGRIKNIQGDMAHPYSRGYICIKGKNEHEILCHSNRVTHPLLRTKGRWNQVSWDTALDTIADRIQDVRERHGSLAVCGVGKKASVLDLFLRSLESPNINNLLDLCALPGHLADIVTMGEGITTHVDDTADFRNSKCILLVGTNLATSNPLQWRNVTKAIADGAKLIVVDPRRSECAEKADIWLQVRPGSDGALALGMLNVIVNEKIYDEQFVDEWCRGFEELKQRVQEYPVEKVEAITWVPAEDIRKAARMFAQNKPASIRNSLGALQYSNSTQTARAFTILVSITGNIDLPGGNLFPTYLKGLKSEKMIAEEYLLPRQIEEKRLGAQHFPLYSGPDSPIGLTHYPTLERAIITGDPYPVKAMLLVSSNAPVTYPGTKKVLKALKSLELLVVCTYTMRPIADFADVVLPRAHPFEMNRIVISSNGQWITAAERVVEPPDECWDDIKIFFQLTEKMKQKGHIDESFIPWRNIDEFNDYILRSIDTTFENFKKKGVITIPLVYKKYRKSGFKTPSGKVELYSSLLEKNGYDPLPYYKERLYSEISTPQLAKKYPLILTSRRNRNTLLSSSMEYPWMRKLIPYPQLWIHPKAAQEREIAEGDLVWIETPRGKCKHKAKITERIHPKVVNAEFGWWLPDNPAPERGCLEVNINAVISYDSPHDPVVGISSIQGLLCEVSRAEDQR